MDWKEKLLDLIKNNKIKTDSDLLDFAEENTLNIDDVCYFLDTFSTKNTPCEGCKYVGLSEMYPCVSCCRNKKDLYERE